MLGSRTRNHQPISKDADVSKTDDKADCTDENTKLEARTKTTVYLPATVLSRVSELAKTHHITLSAAINRMIERGLEYPDDESIRSFRADMRSATDSLTTSMSELQSAHQTEASEIQQAADQILWTTVTLLIGRLHAGDFGDTAEEQRSRRTEIDCLVEEYLQPRVPGCVERLIRHSRRH